MSEKKRTPRVFYVRLAVLIVVAAVLVLGAAAFLYIHNYYHAGDRALAALEDPPEGVSVTEGPGDWIVFADHDDVLTPDALYEIAIKAEAAPEAEINFTELPHRSAVWAIFFMIISTGCNRIFSGGRIYCISVIITKRRNVQMQ